MRYFKYRFPNDSSDLKAQYAALAERKQRTQRQAKVFNRIGTAIFAVVTLLLLGGGMWLALQFIPPEGSGFLGSILRMLFAMVLMICVVIAAPLLGVLAAEPFWKKDGNAEEALRKQLLSKGCAHIREYYGFCEPFLVTKCFDSSDKRFQRHDVCLFFVDGELRLTTNVNYGFFDPSRDLGCYVFQKEEIAVTRVPREQHFAAELKAGEVTFLLGIRAQSFVESHLI